MPFAPPCGLVSWNSRSVTSCVGDVLVSRPHLLSESAQGIYYLTSGKLKGRGETNKQQGVSISRSPLHPNIPNDLTCTVSRTLSSRSCSCLLFHDIPKPPSLRVFTPTQSLSESLARASSRGRGKGEHGTKTGETDRAAKMWDELAHMAHMWTWVGQHTWKSNLRNCMFCKKRAKSVLLLGDHDNWDVHHSVDGLALSLHATRSFTSPLELRELACLCAFSCIRLEDVRHTVSRETLACLCKVVERICQPLFELFSLGSPLGSGRNLLFHVSLVTWSQRSSCHAWNTPSASSYGRQQICSTKSV